MENACIFVKMIKEIAYVPQPFLCIISLLSAMFIVKLNS
jgi:hypothetical protein